MTADGGDRRVLAATALGAVALGALLLAFARRAATPASAPLPGLERGGPAEPHAAAPRASAASGRVSAPIVTEGLLVRVLHADGRPAQGVPVSLYRAASPGHAPVDARGHERNPQAATDGDGLAAFDPEALEEGARYWALVRLSLVEPPEPPGEPPTAPPAGSASRWRGWQTVLQGRQERPGECIELRLPPAGALEVELVGGGASSHLGVVSVEARVRGADVSDSAPTFRARARFPLVPVGVRLELRAVAAGSLLSRPLLVDGPRAIGETVHVTLELLSPPGVTGRAVDETGRVLAHEPYTRPRRLGPRTQLPRTDAEGRFELSEGLAGSRELVLHLGGSDPWAFPQRIARIPLGEGVVPGERRELGDVRFVGEPLTVAGRVVDAGGAPVAGARIRVLEQLAAGRMLPVADRVEVDPEGRFELRGRPRSGRLLVVARRAGGGLARARDVAPGTRDLELVLE